MNKAYVYLVGAGPGDEELISLKGLRAIREADVILYDRLANRELLKYRRENAELIDVGKVPDNHKYPQEEINRLIVDKAKEGKIVTRLKGGDPFVFGRGGEEAIDLKREGIDFEIVPGITSAISVPAYAGIPVTHRNVSTSFHVITGHENPSKEEASVDYSALARLNGTLIFLMGVGRLREITGKLMENGKNKTTPVALVHRGTTAKQKTVVGSLETIVEIVDREKVKSPSIIIVGEVVNLREELKWIEKMPLHGKRILVTRTRQQASELSSKLKKLGGEVVEFPTIELKKVEDFSEIDKNIDRISEFNYLVFTSVNGVNIFFERLLQVGVDVRSLGDIKVIAVGSGTKKALENKGIIANFMPDVFTAEGILEGMKGFIKKGDRVLIPRAEIARNALNEGLETLGADVKVLDIYKTLVPTYNREDLLEILKDQVDIITFTSSSTVKNFLEILGQENLYLIENTKLAAIGPITETTMIENNLKADIVPDKHSIDGLVDKIKEV